MIDEFDLATDPRLAFSDPWQTVFERTRQMADSNARTQAYCIRLVEMHGSHNAACQACSVNGRALPQDQFSKMFNGKHTPHVILSRHLAAGGGLSDLEFWTEIIEGQRFNLGCSQFEYMTEFFRTCDLGTAGRILMMVGQRLIALGEEQAHRKGRKRR